MNRRGWVSSMLLVILITAVGIGLGAWKYASIQASVEASVHLAAQHQPSGSHEEIEQEG